MIQVPDLCIGNWVYDGERTQFPMFVQTIGEDYVYLDFPQNEGDLWESTPEELQGIPITLDFLEKSGFDTSEPDRFMWHKEHDCFEIIIDGDLYYPTVNSNEYVIGEPIKYVHELQNLFWNITKQQLKVNL